MIAAPHFSSPKQGPLLLNYILLFLRRLRSIARNRQGEGSLPFSAPGLLGLLAVVFLPAAEGVRNMFRHSASTTTTPPVTGVAKMSARNMFLLCLTALALANLAHAQRVVGIHPINENIHNQLTPAGTKIGATQNDVAPLVFTLNDASGIFGVNDLTGQLFVKKATNFNYETGPKSYEMTLSWRHKTSGETETYIRRVVVQNINEPPLLDDIPDQKVMFDESFSLDINYGQDPENPYQSLAAIHKVIYRNLHFVRGLPTGFIYTTRPNALRISGISTKGQIGIHPVTLLARDVTDRSLVYEKAFKLNVLDYGNIRARLSFSQFYHAYTESSMQVRIDESFTKAVTITLKNLNPGKVRIVPNKLVFSQRQSGYRNSKTATLSVRPVLLRQNQDTKFTIELAVHNREQGDRRFTKTNPVKIVGRFNANRLPVFPAYAVTISENSHDQLSPEGMKIGKPMLADDSDGRNDKLR
ncbi:MAG: hypothetical protein OXC81_06885 [Betaproteobacteria bacterium]|nr:hypothetical protein [Betaproteobacteria bacterium]